MKLVKTASGKQTVKMSKSEWQSMGKKAGWMKIAQSVAPIQAQIQYVPTNQAGGQFPFVLQLDVAGYSINLPQSGDILEIYQAVQEQQQNITDVPAAPAPGADPTQQI